MSDPRNRKRVLWLAAIGGVLLLSLLFITLLAPTPNNASGSPTIRTASDAFASATTVPTTPRATPASKSQGFSLGGGDLVSLALRLGLVAVIIAGSILGLRWWGKKTTGPKSSTGFLRVVDTLAVGNGRTIHLVALGDRVIAVGATAQQLSYLNELTVDESKRVLDSLPRGAEQSLGGFAAELFSQCGATLAFVCPARREGVIGEDA